MGRINFLSAKWEYLAMFNYEVDPAVLEKHLPPGTELDFFNGKAIVSIVGFMFNDTKVMGIRWPWHVNFEEANLRYYVKRFEDGQWKRGVGFISEIVPKPVIATMANLLYNEHYSTARMKHEIIHTEHNLSVMYSWQKKNQLLNTLQVTAGVLEEPIPAGTEAEFIFEHYYGYNKLNATTSIGYTIQHPRWTIFPVTSYAIECDVEYLYGKEFVPFIVGQQPLSVLLAKGSAVQVKMPVRIKAGT